MSANPEATKAIEAKYLGYTGMTATYSLKVTSDDFRFYASALRDLGVLKKPVDPASLMILQ